MSIPAPQTPLRTSTFYNSQPTPGNIVASSRAGSLAVTQIEMPAKGKENIVELKTDQAAVKQLKASGTSHFLASIPKTPTNNRSVPPPFTPVNLLAYQGQALVPSSPLPSPQVSFDTPRTEMPINRVLFSTPIPMAAGTRLDELTTTPLRCVVHISGDCPQFDQNKKFNFQDLLLFRDDKLRIKDGTLPDPFWVRQFPHQPFPSHHEKKNS